MLALQLIEKETDPVSGLPLSVVMDPANQFKFITRQPVTNWAAHTLAADQKTYYDQHDTDKEHPLNRAGHRWSVYLPEDNSTA